MKSLMCFWLICVSLLCSAQKTYKIISVHDGDTFEIIKNGKKQSCRIANIDAPELKQSFGINSRDSIRSLILGNEIIIDSIGTDIYTRMIVSAKVKGHRLDSLIIQKGWAWHYSIYSKESLLADCMKSAMSQNLGLWSCGKQNVCPPWLFRKYNLLNKSKYCKSCNNK